MTDTIAISTTSSIRNPVVVHKGEGNPLDVLEVVDVRDTCSVVFVVMTESQ